jgi:hypothetical protein
MTRIYIEEAAKLVVVALFISMVAVWALVLS